TDRARRPRRPDARRASRQRGPRQAARGPTLPAHASRPRRRSGPALRVGRGRGALPAERPRLSGQGRSRARPVLVVVFERLAGALVALARGREALAGALPALRKRLVGDLLVGHLLRLLAAHV